jgi:hypothetical protein
MGTRDVRLFTIVEGLVDTYAGLRMDRGAARKRLMFSLFHWSRPRRDAALAWFDVRWPKEN